MLANIVGNVDFNSAAVLCIAFICLCIVVTTVIGKRRGKRELEMQFAIDKQKLHNEDEANRRNNEVSREYKLAELASQRDVQFKRIDSGMIEVQRNG